MRGKLLAAALLASTAFTLPAFGQGATGAGFGPGPVPALPLTGGTVNGAVTVTGALSTLSALSGGTLTIIGSGLSTITGSTGTNGGLQVRNGPVNTLQVYQGSNTAGQGGTIGFGIDQLNTFAPMAAIAGSLANAAGTELQGALVFQTRPNGVAGQVLTTAMTIGSDQTVTLAKTLTVNANIVSSRNTGTPSPTGNITAIGADASNEILAVQAYGGTTQIRMQRQDGTGASPTALAGGDVIGSFTALGGTGAGTLSAASRATVALIADEAWTPTANGARIDISTTIAGTLTTAVHQRITSNGTNLFGIGSLPTDDGVTAVQIAGALSTTGVISGAVGSTTPAGTACQTGAGQAPANSQIFTLLTAATGLFVQMLTTTPIGSTVWVSNRSGNPQTICPDTGGTMNGGTANTGVSIANQASLAVTKIAASTYYTH